MIFHCTCSCAILCFQSQNLRTTLNLVTKLFHDVRRLLFIDNATRMTLILGKLCYSFCGIASKVSWQFPLTFASFKPVGLYVQSVVLVYKQIKFLCVNFKLNFEKFGTISTYLISPPNCNILFQTAFAICSLNIFE